MRKKGRGKGRRESALKEERSDELDGSKMDLEGREGADDLAEKKELERKLLREGKTERFSDGHE